MILTYPIHELREYINWIYFYHAWGFQPRFAGIANLHGCDACRAMWLTQFPENERTKASEAMQLFKEANRMLDKLEGEITVQALFELFEANAQGDDIVIGNTRVPFLRQQQKQQAGEPNLCLSDFIRPAHQQKPDTIGVFATSVNGDAETHFLDDAYKHLLAQTLSSRLAEAAVEKMHEYVRKEAWGYAPTEHLSIADLLAEKYQGIRPAVGYPAIPDQSINFLLDELIDMKQIGIALTENGAMQPHASVSGFLFAHPASRYFHIGKINDDQLRDYAARRNLPAQRMKQFLAANL